jgi:regulatory protein YycH of two-component signal transduction system YycFG
MNWLKWLKHAKRVITFARENKESIKSVILTALIALSLVLTYNLWTYKPNLPELEDPRTVKKQTVEEHEQFDTSNVVHPTQIIYHKGDELYGAEANKRVNEFQEALKKTSFTFESGKNNLTFDPADDKFLKNENYVEIIYPVGMTQDIYKDVFSFEAGVSDNITQHVDRVFLYLSEDKGGVEGYLISYQPKRKQKIIAVNDDPFTPLLEKMNDFVANGDFVPYISHDLIEDLSEGKTQVNDRFYFPKNPIKVNRNAYISKAINEDTKEKYKKALFKDPLSVKSATTDVNIDTLTDGTSAMVINELENRFTYTNFAGLPKRDTSQSKSPLFLSIDFINTHAGWGGNPYILTKLTPDKAGFSLYVDDLPVLDNNMQMILDWNKNELYEYQRSMIELDTRSSYYPEDVTLQSGEEVIDQLIAKDYNIHSIHDVRIGFSLQRQSEIYFLEPKWFINSEDQGWTTLFNDGEEGF